MEAACFPFWNHLSIWIICLEINTFSLYRSEIASLHTFKFNCRQWHFKGRNWYLFLMFCIINFLAFHDCIIDTVFYWSNWSYWLESLKRWRSLSCWAICCGVCIDSCTCHCYCGFTVYVEFSVIFEGRSSFFLICPVNSRRVCNVIIDQIEDKWLLFWVNCSCTLTSEAVLLLLYGAMTSKAWNIVYVKLVTTHCLE